MKNVYIAISAALGLAMIIASWQKWLPLELTETLGFVTGVAYVYLVIKESLWNFPVGIANTIFFFVLFTNSRLYGDAGLQVVYFLLALQGWYSWLHGGQNRSMLRVSRASPRLLAILAVGIVVGTAAMIPLLYAIKGAAPFLDALTTVLSLAAQYLSNRKILENWYLWIVADVIYVYLYITRDLELTAVLYFVFLCLCIAGLRSWRQSLQKGAAEPAEPERQGVSPIPLP